MDEDEPELAVSAANDADDPMADVVADGGGGDGGGDGGDVDNERKHLPEEPTDDDDNEAKRARYYAQRQGRRKRASALQNSVEKDEDGWAKHGAADDEEYDKRRAAVYGPGATITTARDADLAKVADYAARAAARKALQEDDAAAEAAAEDDADEEQDGADAALLSEEEPEAKAGDDEPEDPQAAKLAKRKARRLLEKKRSQALKDANKRLKEREEAVAQENARDLAAPWSGQDDSMEEEARLAPRELQAVQDKEAELLIVSEAHADAAREEARLRGAIQAADGSGPAETAAPPVTAAVRQRGGGGGGGAMQEAMQGLTVESDLETSTHENLAIMLTERARSRMLPTLDAAIVQAARARATLVRRLLPACNILANEDERTAEIVTPAFLDECLASWVHTWRPESSAMPGYGVPNGVALDGCSAHYVHHISTLFNVEEDFDNASLTREYKTIFTAFETLGNKLAEHNMLGSAREEDVKRKENIGEVSGLFEAAYRVLTRIGIAREMASRIAPLRVVPEGDKVERPEVISSTAMHDRAGTLHTMLNLAGLRSLSKGVSGTTEEDTVYTYIKTPDGHNTRACKPAGTTVEFIADCTENRHLTWMWNSVHGAAGAKHYVHELRTIIDDPRFPEYKPNLSLYAFLNGLYFMEQDLFVPYGTRQYYRLSPRTYACHYHAILFDNDAYEDLRELHRAHNNAASGAAALAARQAVLASGGTELQAAELAAEATAKMPQGDEGFWMRLPMPHFFRMLKAQLINRRMADWIMTFIGRIFYPTGRKDMWQKMLVCYGDQGGGKTSLLKYIARTFPAHGVGVIPNRPSQQFSEEHLVGKQFAMAPDIDENFGYDLTALNNMIDGGSHHVNRKHLKALANVDWNTPLAAACIRFPSKWLAKGGFRRLFVVPFPISQWRKGNTRLLQDAEKDRGAFMKGANCAYLYRAQRYNGHSIDKFLPPEFQKTLHWLVNHDNPIVGFIESNAVELGRDLTCPLDEFKAAFKAHLSAIGIKRDISLDDEVGASTLRGCGSINIETAGGNASAATSLPWISSLSGAENKAAAATSSRAQIVRGARLKPVVAPPLGGISPDPSLLSAASSALSSVPSVPPLAAPLPSVPVVALLAPSSSASSSASSSSASSASSVSSSSASSSAPQARKPAAKRKRAPVGKQKPPPDATEERPRQRRRKAAAKIVIAQLEDQVASEEQDQAPPEEADEDAQENAEVMQDADEPDTLPDSIAFT